jgi:hypothetical protein
MSHFAKVEDGIVTQVIVAEQDFIDGLTDADSWVQTSYNTRGGKHYDPETREEDGGTALRKNYAGIGYTYDADRDAFIPPQPYPSWTLIESTCLWECPIEMPVPTDEEEAAGQYYIWDEEAHQADNTQGWVLSGGSE